MKLLEDWIKQTEEDIQNINQDRQYYEDKINMLQCPFEWMRPRKALWAPHVFNEDFDLEIDGDEKFGMIKKHVGKVYEKEL